MFPPAAPRPQNRAWSASARSLSESPRQTCRWKRPNWGQTGRFLLFCFPWLAWRWSSAAAHSGARHPDPALDMEAWRKRWQPAAWRHYLAQTQSDSELSVLRQCTHTGRPLGNRQFIHALEQATLRQLAARKGGRHAHPSADATQDALCFEP